MRRFLTAFRRYAQSGTKPEEQPKGFLDGLLEDAKSLFGIVTDRAFSVPSAYKWKLIVCALYVISPIDLIPDFFLPWGLIDDVAVVGFFLKTLGDLAGEYRRFRNLKPKRRRPSGDAPVEVDAERVTSAS